MANRILQTLSLASAALILSACSTVPDELQVADDVQLIEFSQARSNPEQAVGQTARWGGVIAEVENTDDGSRIEVVNFELMNWGRPAVSDNSAGRFLVYVDEFVDPMVYKQGRSVTFLGNIAEPEDGQINEYKYVYPVLNASSTKLWEERSETQRGINYSPLYFRHQFYDPFYNPWYYRPYRVIRPVHPGGGSDSGVNTNVSIQRPTGTGTSGQMRLPPTEKN